MPSIAAGPAPGPDGLRRPLWLARSVRPAPEAYVVLEKSKVEMAKCRQAVR